MGMMMVGFSAFVPAAPASATPDKSVPMNFTPETGTNSFTAPPVADNSDCKGIIPTPGSDPAVKQVDLSDGTPTFAPGTWVPFVVHDNAHANDGNTSTYTLHDCVASYTSGQLPASDFESPTGEPLPGTESQVKDYTAVVDQAHLTGIPSNTTDVHYSWQIPADALPGTVFCNFVKDTGNNHGGGGNRKAGAACFQVPQGLTVTKTVSGPLATPWSFTAHVVCTNDQHSPYDLVLSNTTPSKSISPIPTGSTCTVTEPNNNGASTTTITPNKGVVTIPTTGNQAVGILNVFPTPPTPGSLTVVKSVAGPKPAEWDFTAHVVCVKEGSDDLVFDLALSDESPSASHSNIAAGSVCTVTEPSHPGTTVVISPNNGVVTVPTGGAEVDIVNTYPPTPGGLTVTKTVSGDTAPTDWTFVAHVVCGNMDPFNLTLTEGTPSQTRSNIPAGTTCTVTEPDSQNATTVTITPNNGVVTIPSGSNTQVGILNTYPSSTGGLTVAKSVTGGNRPDEWSFTAHVECTPPQVEDSVVRASSVNSFDLVLTSDDPTVTRTGLPAGTTCTVTEPDHKGATTVTITPNGGVVTITAGQDSEVDITNNFPSSPPPVIPPPVVTNTPSTPLVSVVKTNDAGGNAFAKSNVAKDAGDKVDFLATITNTSSETETITSITDSYGTVVNSPECASLIGTSLASGASKTCGFTINGYAPPAGSSITNTVAVLVTDVNNKTANASDTSTVSTPTAAVLPEVATTVPPTTTTTAPPPKAATPTAVLPLTGSRTLPFTGTNVRLLLLAGLGLLLVGLGLLVGTWRPEANHFRS